MDMLDHHIVVTKLGLVDGFVFLFRICLLQENLYRHEGAVLADDLAGTVFVGELQTVLVQEQGNLGTDLSTGSLRHIVFGTAIALPVNGFRAILIGKGVDVNLVCYHECGVEAQSEMTDDLIVIGLVLVFLQEISRAGKGDLVDVFLDLVCRHAQSGIDEFQCFVLRIYHHADAVFMSLRIGVFANQGKLFELRDSVAAVGNQLAEKDIVVGIEPLFDNRENIFTVNGKASMCICHCNSLLL